MEASLIFLFAISACASSGGCHKGNDTLQVKIPAGGSGGQSGASGVGGAGGNGQPGPACGAVTCPTGQTCCNASCGSCTPPGGSCTKILCQPPKADGGAGAGACQTDSDCRLFDDYCTGCDCRSLAKGEPVPKCSGPGVSCFAQPCARKTAACQAGHCLVRGLLTPR